MKVWDHSQIVDLVFLILAKTKISSGKLMGTSLVTKNVSLNFLFKGIQHLVPVRLSGFLAGYPVPGIRSRSGFPVSWPVIRYPASGPGPVFWFPGRLSGTRHPVPVRFSGWPASNPVYPASGFRFHRFPVLQVSGVDRFPTIPRNSGSVSGFGLGTAPFM